MVSLFMSMGMWAMQIVDLVITTSHQRLLFASGMFQAARVA